MNSFQKRLSTLRAWLRRKPKSHLLPVKWGDTVILVHNGRAWQALTLQEVTTTRGEGTVATFVSLERKLRVAKP